MSTYFLERQEVVKAGEILAFFNLISNEDSCANIFRFHHTIWNDSATTGHVIISNQNKKVELENQNESRRNRCHKLTFLIKYNQRTPVHVVINNLII
jgi:hypothetical protein